MATTIEGRLRKAGVTLVAVAEWTQSDNEMSNLWMRLIHKGRAESESLTNRMHTLDGMKSHCQSQDPETGWAYKNGGLAPFGFVTHNIEYGRDRKGRPRLRAVWELGETVQAGHPNWEWRRLMCQWRLEGLGMKAIRNRLNAAGVRTTAGRPWAVSSVHALMEPHAIHLAAGHYIWNRGSKQSHRRTEGLKKTEDWVIVENAHPAIIDDDSAQQIIAIVREPSPRHCWHRREDSPWILSGGILRCGACGGIMTSWAPTPSRRYYLCPAHRYRGGVGCPAPRIPLNADDLEQIIVEEANDLWEITDAHLRRIVDAYNAAVVERHGTNVLLELDRERRRVRREKERIVDATKAGVPLDALLTEECRRLELEEERIAEQMLQARAAQVELLILDDLRAQRDYVREQVRGGTPETHREFVHGELDEIVFRPDEMNLYLKHRRDSKIIGRRVVAPRGVDDKDNVIVRMLAYVVVRGNLRVQWAKAPG